MKKVFAAVLCAGLLFVAQSSMAQEKGKGKGKGKAGAGDVAKGMELFESNCGVCHNSDSEERKMSPGLKGLFTHAKLVNDKPVNDANVTELISNGGNGMPGFADLLTGPERADLMAFLHSL